MRVITSWVIVSALLTMCGVWMASAGTPCIHAQAEDGTGGALYLRDRTDLAVLQSILTYPETAAYIQDALIESHASRITLQWQPGPSTADREYFFTIRFPDRGAVTDSVLVVSYTHDGSTGGAPALSPDSCTYEYVEGVPRTPAGAIVVPDSVAYDFLVHVLTVEPRFVWKVARGGTITGLRVEENERSPGGPEYCIHLEVTRGREFRTVTLVSRLGKGGDYGRLRIRRN